MRGEHLAPAYGCRQPLRRFQRRIPVMAIQPWSDALAQCMMIIRNRKIFEGAIHLGLLLAMPKISETRAAPPQEPELPFGKGITALQPAALTDHLPAAIISGGGSGSFRHRLGHRLDKIGVGHFVGIEKQYPRMF